MSTGTYLNGQLAPSISSGSGGQGNGGTTCKSATVAGYDLSTLDQHLQRIEADFAAYRRMTDAKLADHHTELVQLRTQFHKLFDAMQHVGEPPFTMPVDDWIINE